jgi:hypothetical protein
MERLVQTFDAQTDEGHVYTLHVCQKCIEVPTRADPNAVCPALKSIRTSDGKSVNRLDRGKYQIVETGIILHSDSPDAP